MLSRKFRLTRSEFKKLDGGVRVFHSPLISLFVYKGTDREVSKFTVSVSKKTLNKAVKRNLLRRRVYSVLAKNINNIKSGFVFILSFKKGVEKLDFKDMEVAILDTFKAFKF